MKENPGKLSPKQETAAVQDDGAGTLGWNSLRSLPEESVRPVLRRDDVLFAFTGAALAGWSIRPRYPSRSMPGPAAPRVLREQRG
jgi:hypothetical protein